MKNIGDIRNCYGCGLCAVICAKKIIQIRLNSDGFYEPYINQVGNCTECGLCLDVCSFNRNELSAPNSVISSYAAWSNEKAVQRKCTSGGVAFEIGRCLIEQGYKVCGVRFDAERNRAEHYIASTVEELIPSIGSKYIQSYTVDGFKTIDRKQKYLVVGTPCQIDSFRRYIRKFRCEDNFVLMDFFCHGVPSKLMWDKYVAHAERKIGKLTYASWRNKFTGWHDSWAMAMDGTMHGEPVSWHDSYNLLMREKKSFLNSRMSQGDFFYCSFIGHFCLGGQCHKDCKYKYTASSADIRVGDCWGETYKKEEDGVSGVITYTQKGIDVLKASNITLITQDLSVVSEGQMKKNAKPAILRDKFIDKLHNPHSTVTDLKWIIFQNRVLNLIDKIAKHINGKIRRNHNYASRP